MLLDQPEVRCKNGHVIPANATVQALDKYGHQHVRTEVVNGVPLQTSRLVCEECAREAGGTVPPRQRAVKGRDLEKYGQCTVYEIFGEIPMLRIGRDGK